MIYQNELWFGTHHIHKDMTGSTNDDIKELVRDNPQGGYVVRAAKQINGKGRRGRQWVSEDGGLYFSFDVSPVLMERAKKAVLTSAQAPMVTLLAAMSVCEAIRERTGLDALIKWPNDIVVHGRKLCGILTEMVMKGSDIDLIIVGIGINLMQEHFPTEIVDTATSLKKAMKDNLPTDSLEFDVLDCDMLVNRVIENMHYFYDLYFEDNKEVFIDCYNQRLAGIHGNVKVLDPKGEYTGVSLGVNESGELLVRKQNGEIVSVYAGEVSVRGIYGYI